VVEVVHLGCFVACACDRAASEDWFSHPNGAGFYLILLSENKKEAFFDVFFVNITL
jgi:hypothetical protein